MADRPLTPRSSSLTPILAGAALVLAGYLVLDRIGVFETRQSIPQRVIAPRGDLAESEKTTIQIFEANAPSAVHITATQRNAQGTGSGIIWDAAGHILTNYHVVRGADTGSSEILVRLHDNQTFVADYVYSYAYLDLAMVKLRNGPRNLRPAVLGESANLKVGQSVFAIGNPFGLEQTLTTGIISALNRSIQTRGDVELDGLIQVDAAINPGNSGGLLLDSAGRLIGMNTAIYSKSGESVGIGFAVPIDRIAPMVPRMLARKPPIEAGLGIQVRNLRQPLNREVGYGYGVIVAEVVAGGGAAAAGLRPLVQGQGGDVIVRADGERIETMNGLYRILEKRKDGDTIEVQVARFNPDLSSYRLFTTEVTLKALEVKARR